MKQDVKHCKKIKVNLDFIASVFFLFIILCIAVNPIKYSAVAFKGLEVWAKILVPSLLPFFILTKLFAKGNFLNDFTSIFAKPMKKIYKCPKQSSYIFFMSILSGYPVGAKLVADFYNLGQISKEEAVKTLSFSANSGPMFILGSVAIGMFGNRRLGIIIYLSHIIGSLLNGLVYKNYKSKESKVLSLCEAKPPIGVSFSENVNSSISSVLLIGGVICFTFVLIEVVTSSFIFKNIFALVDFVGFDSNFVASIFSGVFEITKGCLMLSELPYSIFVIAPICTFIISFGGISTLLQASVFTKGIISTKMFVLQKITHAVISCLVCLMLVVFV